MEIFPEALQRLEANAGKASGKWVIVSESLLSYHTPLMVMHTFLELLSTWEILPKHDLGCWVTSTVVADSGCVEDFPRILVLEGWIFSSDFLMFHSYTQENWCLARFPASKASFVFIGGNQHLCGKWMDPIDCRWYGRNPCNSCWRLQRRSWSTRSARNATQTETEGDEF